MKRQFMLGVAALALTMGLSACQRGDAPKADATKATTATPADTAAATTISAGAAATPVIPRPAKVELREGRFAFEVFTTYRSNIAYLGKLGVTAQLCRFSRLDLLLTALGSYAWWHGLQKRLRLVGQLEKALLRSGCDLVYFVTPSDRAAIVSRWGVGR